MLTRIPTLEQLYERIEGNELLIQANLASGYKMFTNIINDTPAFQELLRALDSPEVGGRVVARVHQLVDADIDDRFENPKDVALAAYTLAMARKHLQHGRLVATIAGRAPNTWWARHACRSIPTLEDTFKVAPDSTATDPTDGVLRSPLMDSGEVVTELFVLSDTAFDSLLEPYEPSEEKAAATSP